jgi:hypothetical protein
MNDRYTKVGNYYIRRPHAVKVGPERATLADVLEIVGGTIAFLLLFAALAYGPWLLWGGAR